MQVINVKVMPNKLQEVLAHKRNKNAAAIAAIIRDEKILLGLREYENAETVWVIPGGSIDHGETLEQAVRREVKEETAIDDLDFVAFVGKVQAEDRDPLYVFHCESTQQPKLAEPNKFSEWKWFDLERFADGQPDNYINEPCRQVILDYFQENGIIDAQ
jgi:8-oxo-dGTP pyrophosphatase MutT (NUDIX family)